MSLTIDPSAQALLQGALEPGEALQWADRPRAWAYIAPPRLVMGLGLLWAAFDSFYVAGAFGPGVAVGPRQDALLRLLALHVLPLGLLLGWPLLRWLAWRRAAYAITGRRVVVRQGLLGALRATALDQVEAVGLSVGGPAFGVGHVTLRLAPPAKDLHFRSVDDAYHVAKLARGMSGAESPSPIQEGKPQA
jgi:hypothetical protein